MSLAPAFSTAPAPRPIRLTARVWRPFARQLADIIGVEDCRGQPELQMHPWFAVSLVRCPSVLQVESRREVIAPKHSLVLVPAFHLYGLRALGEQSESAITLLLRGGEFEQCCAQPAIATDAALGERLAGLLSHLLAPVALVEHETATLAVLEQLLASSAPLAPDRARGSGSLQHVRTYLKANLGESLSTAEVSRLSKLSEGQTIRSFHYEFGLPPHAYHLRVRLAAACERISRGGAIARVAHECGFADQSHLNRRFKEVYGVTPATWAAGAAAGARFQ